MRSKYATFPLACLFLFLGDPCGLVGARAESPATPPETKASSSPAPAGATTAPAAAAEPAPVASAPEPPSSPPPPDPSPALNLRPPISYSEAPTDTAPSKPTDPKAELPDLGKGKNGAPAPAPHPITDKELEQVGESGTEILESKLLSMSARFDAGYGAGNAVQQGFSLPSLRLNAYGSVGEYLGYRISLGETREFSSAMLPQITPQQAYITVGRAPAEGSTEGSSLLWQLGMFTPTLSPWWSPDLQFVNLPTYNESQRALLLSPDIGTELSYFPFGDRLKVTVGLFNGNGNYSLNVNNAKAFSAFIQGWFPIGTAKVTVGSGAFSTSQSTPGDTNYKSNWASDTFVSLEWRRLTTTLDFMTASFEDSTRVVGPFGVAGSVWVRTLPWLSVFTRVEQLANSPVTGGQLRHYQFGPELEFLQSIKAFVTYDYLDTGDGTAEQGLLVRVRLII